MSREEGWQRDDARNARLFSGLLAAHGETARALDWGSAESQRLRFEVLAGIAPLAGRRILDVGCGLGDLLAWLRERKIDVDYAGIDVTPSLVAAARRRFPGERFECRSAVSGRLPRADFVLASGIFAHRRAAPASFLKETVRALFAACREGVAFNSLSAWSPQRERGEFHADPLRTVKECRQLTPWVVLRHDYHPRDFTVYLRRR